MGVKRAKRKEAIAFYMWFGSCCGSLKKIGKKNANSGLFGGNIPMCYGHMIGQYKFLQQRRQHVFVSSV